MIAAFALLSVAAGCSLKWCEQFPSAPCCKASVIAEVSSADSIAEPCPFASSCMNSEDLCAACFKSPWYDSDHKCTCGPSSDDWMTEDQCTACSQLEVESTADPCPFASSCMNSEGLCAACFKSPWFDSDHKCTCGPSSDDWMTEDQCTACSNSELEFIATADPCPFASSCRNSEGECAACTKSPWFDSDHKCICGPSEADWVTEDQCKTCPNSEFESTADPCPFASTCTNSEGVCASCFKSLWYDSDHKCTCGASAADWMTEDQCTACSLRPIAV